MVEYLRKFIQIFERNLDQALAEKTSWGRNDLKLVIKTVLNNTLLEIMENGN